MVIEDGIRYQTRAGSIQHAMTSMSLPILDLLALPLLVVILYAVLSFGVTVDVPLTCTFKDPDGHTTIRSQATGIVGMLGMNPRRNTSAWNSAS
jgi:hypothetical protein